MKFTIDEKIFKRFLSLHVGVVVAKGISNSGENAEVLTVLAQQAEHIRATHTLDTLQQEPQIRAWREAYAAFGAKPKKYTCSVENLYRMILEGVQMRHINTVVDIYNTISLKYMVPIGGDDIDHVDGDIVLRFATGNEPFIRMNGEEVDHPKEGEVIYADDKEVLCRRWNWRECDKSKMTGQTKNVTLVVEGILPVTAEDMKQIVSELGHLVQNYCGGRVDMHVLTKENNEMVIT